ncbi:DUF928 domain-containing protein [Leptolyngbya sp. AN03gr2]|uniref:DUF928 domain-containing protein n=1 Tax=unclassified Leptolyngbya TaxID=2650499 RepID=UPI003D3199AA
MSKLFSASLAIATFGFVMVSHVGGQLIEFGSAASANQPQQRVRWRPNPRMGSARSTLSGGRRGSAIAQCDATRIMKPATLTLLVPQANQGLFTTVANPTFFWHTETDRPTQAEFILSDPNQAEPVFTKTVAIDRSGISRVALPAEFALKAGTRYRWTVLLSCNGGASKEVVARSFVERIENAGIQQQVSSRSSVDRASKFAAEGIWYDAIATLIEAAQHDPNNSRIKAELRSLLSQVGRPSIEIAQVLEAMFGS